MWVLKLKIPYKPGIKLCDLAIKHNATLFGYPVSITELKRGIRLIISGYAESDNTAALFNGAKNAFENVETNGNFAIIELKHQKYVKKLFQAGIFFTKPIILNPLGDFLSFISHA